MEEGLNLLLGEFIDEELEEEELEEIEAALDKEQQKEFKEALQTFFDNSDELPSAVNKAVSKLAKLIIALSAAETEEEEEEEKRGGEKVKKSKPWSFTFTPEED